MKPIILSLVVVVAACGSVDMDHPHDDAPADPDAPGADAGDVDAPAPDAPSDAPPPPTALAADGVATFPALDGVATVVPWRAGAYDDAHELGADGRITLATSGDVEVCAVLAGPATLAFTLEVYVDGAAAAGLGAGTGYANGCASLAVTAGQVLDVRVTQHAGSAQSFTNDAYASWLTVRHDAVLVEATTMQSFALPVSTFTAVPYGHVVRDPGHLFDAATSTFTAPAAGDYRFCTTLQAPVPFEIDAFKNGGRDHAFALGSDASQHIGVGCRSLRLAAGDRVDLRAYQVTTATTVASNTEWNRLTVVQQTTGVSLGGVSSFTAPANTLAQLPYVTVLANDNGAYDLATHRYTAAAAGDYEVCASFTILNGMPLEIDLFAGGVRQKALSYQVSAAQGCRIVRVPAGTTLEIQVNLHLTTTTTCGNNGFWDWLTVARLA